MKYANIYWQNTETKNGTRRVNIGDNLQFMAVDNLYKRAMINKEDIVYLKMEELCDYIGEMLILPMNWSLFDANYMRDGKIAISQHITPVFLATTIESATHDDVYFNEYNIAYLKKYEPIGCRDEYTMQVLCRYGIDAYLNGCMTLTFEKRNKDNVGKKIFVIDAPRELSRYMPEEIKENCEVLTQQYYYGKEIGEEEIIVNIKEQYRKYAEEAALIITSRLHVASPAVAMGIPVIFAREKVDYRFSWLDRLLPLYDGFNYAQIDWTPKVIDCEAIKKLMTDNAIKRIQQVYDRNLCAEISMYFGNRIKHEYVKFQETILGNLDKAYRVIASKYKRKDIFLYSVWGMTGALEKFYCYMRKEYPNAKLKNVIDSFRKEKFHEIMSITPEEFIMAENEIVVVLAVSASNAAKDVFERKGIPEDDYVCVGDLFFEKR